MRALWLTASLLIACGPTQRGNSPDAACTEPGCVTPVCVAGAVESCYTGPLGTDGVGACKSGTRTCTPDGLWGACNGEVVPRAEICANGIDDDCNNMVDEELDADGDGFTTCQGDCCDNPNQGCETPALVNPGAFEVAGNQLDDDCDGIVDNAVAATCDMGLASNSTAAMDYAKAMDLCQTAGPNDAKWGVISAQLLRADGTGVPNAIQHSIRPAFGGTTVQGGNAFAVLSTGSAAAQGQTLPNFVNFQTGPAIGTTSGFPADFLAAHAGALPNAPGCPAPSGNSANDPVMLQLKIRAPTNARSFSFSMNFLSSEYPEWTCSPFNDFFVVLLDSTFAGSPPNPADKNLAFYKDGAGQVYPVGVNLAFGNTGLFTQCANGPTGCASLSVPGNISTCLDTAGLVGTGMDQANPPRHSLAAGQPGFCGANNLLGGGTGWLVTSGNVVGGETITLRIALWDTSDGLYDSVAIIDNFQWSVEASQPGTVIQ
ncbi:MAG: choice-of-anchor L domain-containing protein [Deltaproteobacteria bacterium]|nr:choice-of-anchor L domain-containing protein [Deltaproteobacteria bacterium]MCW5806018.1 choice-of-anchor L domain-containing protein [Deltaproteobacteria bacterium]